MPSKDEAGNRLAHSHFGIEPGISRIFRIREAGANEERLNSSIKLLEVNADSFAVGIMPLLFGPARRSVSHSQSRSSKSRRTNSKNFNPVIWNCQADGRSRKN